MIVVMTALHTGRIYSTENNPGTVLISVRGGIDTRTIVWQKDYVNEIIPVSETHDLSSA
jgi:hypothetical protein